MTAAQRDEARLETVFSYHEETKHHLHRYARSLGYLNWKDQPNPFREFHGAPRVELPLAIPLIATGVRLAAAQVWATATIAAIIGSGGLGQLVTVGYATQNYGEVYGGVVVVVRPDQYVANVLPLTATAELSAFFAPLLPDRISEGAP